MKPLVLFLCLMLVACKQKTEESSQNILTQNDEAMSSIDLYQIQDGGEMIMVTMSGPDTYYDYNGTPLGLQYELCENYAQSIGVRLRVEVAKDAKEMVSKLLNGSADLIAAEIPLSDSLKSLITFCGTHTDSAGIKKLSWATRNNTPQLAQSLNAWYKPTMKDAQRKADQQRRLAWEREKFMRAPRFKLRNGELSPYDALFRRFSGRLGWDWRLMAAQAYQESAFNANAVSWAGACGVMQIMPSTAAQIGIKREDLFNPATNIQGAAYYIAKLNNTFSSVSNPIQRHKFVLAAYNGGTNHIKDAMALAKKYGKNPDVWDGNVEEFVLLLSSPRYYNDPVVKYGYMRGNETYNYVRKILARWSSYRGKRRSR